MEVRGARNLLILEGGEPQALRGTKFMPGEVGSGVVTQTYTITNTSASPMELGTSPVVFAGSPNISVQAQPPVTSLPGGASTNFTLSFDRSVFGLHIGTVNVYSNAAGAPHTFEVQGRAFHAGPPNTVTFVGAAAIPDNNATGVTIPFDVTGVVGQICTLQVRANGSNCTNATLTGIQHSWIGDLAITLISPKGKVIRIMDRPGVTGSTGFGNSGDNLCQTVFDDTAMAPIETAPAAAAPFTGTYRPEEPIYEVTGDNANGLWSLRVSDHGIDDLGTVRNISLIFRTETSPASATDWNLFY
jgi:subtilisin-like proprotein convertase family protein